MIAAHPSLLSVLAKLRTTLYGTELNVSIVCTEEENMAVEKVSSFVRYNGRYSIAVSWKEQRL